MTFFCLLRSPFHALQSAIEVNSQRYERKISAIPPGHFSSDDSDSPSPFIQSILEPVNLLRTVTTDEPDAWNFLSGPFTFETSQTTATRNHLSTMKPHDRSAVLRSQQSLPFVNHLLLPRTTPIEANLSAFKPLESGNSRSTSSFVFKRPTAIGRSTESHWFGQN